VDRKLMFVALIVVLSLAVPLPAAPGTQPTTQPATQPTTQASQMEALREATAQIRQLRDQLQDAYRQIHDLQDQVAQLQKRSPSGGPPRPAAAGKTDPNELGEVIVRVENRAVRAGMTVDQATTAITGGHSNWDGPQQTERTGDETVFRWRKWETKPGDTYHAAQRVVVGTLTATFKNGKMIHCKWSSW
jgi:hypothetical protein